MRRHQMLFLVGALGFALAAYPHESATTEFVFAPSDNAAPKEHHVDERPSDAAKKHSDGEPDNRGTEERPLIVQIQPQHHNEVAADAKPERHWYDDPEWWTAWFTLGLFISTTALWIFTWKLWNTTKDAVAGEQNALKVASDTAKAAADHVGQTARTADAMKEVAVAMAKSTEIAKISADATAKLAASATLSAQAAIGVELPRLEVEQAVLVESYTNAQRAIETGDIRIAFYNHGRTTAHIIETCVIGVVPEYDFLPTKARYPLSSVVRSDIGTITAAENTYVIDCYKRISAKEGDAISILKGEKKLWVYGYIRYRDFLDGIWTTKFCLTYSRTATGYTFDDESVYPDYVGRSRDDPRSNHDETENLV